MAELSGSILVVDDSEANRDLLSRRLERRGFRVTTAEGGTKALELVRENDYDLVLLDVMMPDIGGIEVLRTLRQKWSATDLPVIIATAKQESEDIVEGLKAGANDYVTKPLDMPVVLARVQSQLSLKRAVAEIRRLEQSLEQRNRDLEAANQHLASANTRMAQDLRAAARIQESMLPGALPQHANARFAWFFRPCVEIAGDGLNIVRLDDDHVGLYVLDVVGHGVAASLLSVAVSRVMTPSANSFLVRRAEAGGAPRLLTPREVAVQLSQRFPWEASTAQFFTLVYGILDVRTRELRFVCAGHPPPIYIPHNGTARLVDSPGGLPIGLGEENYVEHQMTLGSGDRIYFYSDGISDAMNVKGETFQTARVLEALNGSARSTLDESLAALWRSIEEWSVDTPLHDDASVAALEITG